MSSTEEEYIGRMIDAFSESIEKDRFAEARRILEAEVKRFKKAIGKLNGSASGILGFGSVMDLYNALERFEKGV